MSEEVAVHSLTELAEKLFAKPPAVQVFSMFTYACILCFGALLLENCMYFPLRIFLRSQL